MTQNNDPAPSTSGPSMSLGKALLIGHITVSLPELLIMLIFIVAGRDLFDAQFYWLFLVAGFVFAWLWWAFMTPRWRRWALGRGAPVEELRKWSTITGIPWPKRAIFEKEKGDLDG